MKYGESKVLFCIIQNFFILFISCRIGASAVTQHNLTTLGTFPGGLYSVAYGVNDLGHVVGKAGTASNTTHAFLWKNGFMTDLGVLNGDESCALGINNRTQIIGWQGYGYSPKAFIWENGVMTNINPVGATDSRAYAINNDGTVVGDVDFGPNLAFVWKDGVMITLDITGTWVTATGVNDAGQIAGRRRTSSDARAFYWDKETTTYIGTFGGAYSYANDINNLGQVVGETTTSGGDQHAFLWQNGQMTDLGYLSESYSHAESINDYGQIVGSSYATNNNCAFLWENGAMYNLNNLIPSDSNFFLTQAYCINNKGQIVGCGQIPGININYAYLLTPVPEPSTIFIVMTGLFALMKGKLCRKK